WTVPQLVDRLARLQHAAAFGNNLPSEAVVARLFSIDRARASKALKTVLRRRDLKAPVHQALRAAFDSIPAEAAAASEEFLSTPALVDGLNGIVAEREPTARPIRPKRNAGSIYSIQPSAYIALRNHFLGA